MPSKFPTVTTGRTSDPATAALPCQTFTRVPRTRSGRATPGLSRESRMLALRGADPVPPLRPELSHLLRRDRCGRDDRDRDRRDDGELRTCVRLRPRRLRRGVVSLPAPPILLPAVPAPRGFLRGIVRVPRAPGARAR